MAGQFLCVDILAEVTLQQTLESLTMTGLVTGHLVDGVVDGVQVQLLGLLGQVELALGRAALGLHPHFQVLLGGVGEHLAQQLGELGGVLGLLQSGAAPVKNGLFLGKYTPLFSQCQHVKKWNMLPI